VDVGGTAMLDGEPAMRAGGVDGDDKLACKGGSRPQQTRIHCEEDDQRNKNTKEDVPIAHSVMLEGDQATCASGSMRDSRD